MSTSKLDTRSRSIAAATVCAAVAVAAGCGPAAWHKPDTSVVKRDCSTADFRPTVLQERAKPSVVRILTDAGATGSGFIIAPDRDADALYIATNYHVVITGTAFQAEFTTRTDDTVKISGLEVIKVDQSRDLALLRAPMMTKVADGLPLNANPVRLAQEVVAMGFPHVAGSDYQFTVEMGQISATDRKVGDRAYLVTNANINPGNSGGPVVDACGQVIGIVSAVSRSTERTGFVIPVAPLIELYEGYQRPRHAASKEIQTRLGDFFSALTYKQPIEAAGFVSHGFLRQEVQPLYAEAIKTSLAKVDEVNKTLRTMGYDPDKLPSDKYLELLENLLTEDEYLSVYVSVMVQAGQLSEIDGLRVFLGYYISKQLFGEVRGYDINRIKETTDDKAQVRLAMHTPKGRTMWVFDMVYEWGDWRISGFTN